MRNVIVITLIISLQITSTKSNCQVLGKFFYNYSWELTRQETSVYFRTCVFDTVNYWFAGQVKDFTRNGRLLMEGYYKEGKKNGKFTFYYESGNIESEGNFENNLPSGKWRYFYPDGTSKQDVTFDGQGFYVHFFVDSTGNKILDNGTGNWYDIYEEYKTPSLIIVKGSFYEGKKTGDWECLFENGVFLYKEKFKNGEFKKGFRINLMGEKTNEYFFEVKNKLLPHFKHDIIERFEREGDLTRDDYPFLKFLRSNSHRDSSHRDSTSSDQIFLVVEESARPVGGMQEFYKHVGKVMTYPKEARRMGIQGKVFVEFVINKDGSISDVKVIKGIGGGCDEEAVRAVKTAPPWIPGKQKGNLIRQRYVVPITFAISSIKIKM